MLDLFEDIGLLNETKKIKEYKFEECKTKRKHLKWIKIAYLDVNHERIVVMNVSEVRTIHIVIVNKVIECMWGVDYRHNAVRGKKSAKSPKKLKKDLLVDSADEQISTPRPHVKLDLCINKTTIDTKYPSEHNMMTELQYKEGQRFQQIKITKREWEKLKPS